MDKKKLIERIKSRIIYYQAKRDHSIKEIRDKIISRIENSEEYVDEIIEDFIEKKYISEERFVESFIRYKRNQNNGSVKIKNELSLKGISSSMASLFIEEYEDWYDLAYKLKLKKYGEEIEKDYNKKSKQIRYIVSRGFSFDEAKHAVDFNPEDI